MARYYFNIRNDVDTDDAEGVELPDLDAAREHAMDGARDLVCADIKKGYLNLDHRIIVTDERGDEVLTLTFRQAFEFRSDGP